MKFIDLQTQLELIRPEIDTRIKKVLDHGQFILGPEVFEFEESLSSYIGVKHCISCSSGTDALIMSLMAYGIGKGDFVMTTPYTFIATAEAIKFVGATPLFVDIDIATFNISADNLESALHSIKSKKHSIHSHLCNEINKIKAVITVDLFGLPADAEKINNIAKAYNLTVIEDAAQSIGGEMNKKKAGSLSDIGCTSFFPAKPLGCYGDGGAIFTNDEKIATVLKSIRVHGQGDSKYQNTRLGITGRLDTIQAAILLSKLDLLESEVAQRQLIARSYFEKLNKCRDLKLPLVPEGYKSAYSQYTLLTMNEQHRTLINKKLSENNIPTAIYYSHPLHQQEVFSDLGYSRIDFETSMNAASRALSLPMHPYLTEEQIENICQIVLTA